MAQKDKIEAEKMNQRMLTGRGIIALDHLNIYKELISALSFKDLLALEKKNVYFNPLYSPASQSEVNIDIPKGSKIITIDINTLELFTPQEGIAIILHEIGHALHPNARNEEDEFLADDYAVNHGYKNEIISCLEKGKTIRPELFVKEMTEKRINRLKLKI